MTGTVYVLGISTFKDVCQSHPFRETGQLYLQPDKYFSPFDMYDVKVSVRNVRTNVTDEMTLTVASGEKNIMDKYSAFNMNGYELAEPVHLLSRHKRVG